MDFLRLLPGDEQTPAQASGGDPPAGTALASAQRANDVDDVRMSRRELTCVPCFFVLRASFLLHAP
jgi:hypothetical protein